jgi:hypothetical protein
MVLAPTRFLEEQLWSQRGPAPPPPLPLPHPTHTSLHHPPFPDKTIKLWKVYDKQLKVVSAMNVELGRYGGPVPVSRLRIPTLAHAESAVVATPRRVYANAHAYHLNSISANSDGESFLSADDLRVNLWQYGDSKVTLSTWVTCVWVVGGWVGGCVWLVGVPGWAMCPLVDPTCRGVSRRHRARPAPPPCCTMQTLWTSSRPTWRS